jgi:hypothetical protein
MLYINSIEDIEKVFREGTLAEVTAVLRHRELQPIWLTAEGLRARAILHERDPEMFPAPPPSEVHAAYQASDSAATKALFARLKPHGADGKLAIELFRACKASARAKVYRGGVRGVGTYRSMSYDRKQAAMDRLCHVLEEIQGTHEWGWGIDDMQPVHRHVLYLDLPTGQVSFHTDARGKGPDYGKEWDGQLGQSADRICRWIQQILSAPAGSA